MTKLDSFSAQLVDFVRRHMADDAILALVRHQLDLGGDLGVVADAAARGGRAAPTRRGPGRPAGAAKAAAPKARGKRRRGGPRGPRNPEARTQLLSSVEKAVKSSRGLSAGDLARALKAPQSRVAAALRDLKHAKRIFQGGDRRFARYAGDAKTAIAASQSARKNAGKK